MTDRQADECRSIAAIPEHLRNIVNRIVRQRNHGELVSADVQKIGDLFNAREEVSGSSPTNERRSRKSIKGLMASLFEIIERDRPMTCRQVFYRAVSAKLIDKTEAEYKTAICRLLAVMRREGTLPFNWIADNTRWMRKPRTHHGLAGMLDHAQRTYRRAIWDDQDVYDRMKAVEDAEKDTLREIADRLNGGAN